MIQRALTIEDMCRKLKPVLGNKIDKIYFNYATAEGIEAREEIGQYIKVAYQKHLGELLDKGVLLEPPKEDVLAGEYPIADIIYSDKKVGKFNMREADWPRHVCVSGMSGSGKTTAAFTLLKNFMAKDKNFLVFDWKKSFRPLLKLDEEIMCFTVGNGKVANQFRVNINEPPRGIDPKSWIITIADLLTESFSASFGVHKIILETLDEVYKENGVYDGSEVYPTWKQLKVKMEEKLEVITGRQRDWLESALRIATVLSFGDFGEVINAKKKSGISFEDLLNKKVILELNSLGNIEKKIFCEFVLTYIYRMKKARSSTVGNNFDHAILVDEAHNVFLKDKTNFVSESVTDQIYREMREYGTSLICLDQHVSKLSDTVKGNSACHIAFQQQLPDDIDVITNISRVSRDAEVFSQLAVGQAVVKLSDRHTAPFLVKFENDLDREVEVDDFYLRQRMLAKLVDYENNQKVRIRNEIISEKESKKDLFSEIHWLVDNLLKDKKNALEIKDELEKYYDSTDIIFVMEKMLDKKNPLIKIQLGIDEKRLVDYLIKNPHHKLTTVELYRQVELSARKGNIAKKALLEREVLKVEEVRYERGWKKYIRLA